MADRTTELKVSILPDPDDDQLEVERLTRQLRRELADLEVETVAPVRAGAVPEHAKAGDPVSWGQLLVALVASGGVLTTLIGTLQAWLTRNERRGVTVEIEGDKLQVAGISTYEQRRLIDAWIARRTKSHSSD